jgi:anti-sigma28 factor (negative regulator of flagellin synthesis)
VNSVTLRISNTTPPPEPNPANSATVPALNGQRTEPGATSDLVNLSPVSGFVRQATEGDPQRVEALRLKFQSGQYAPDAQQTSEKMVEGELQDPLKP